MNGEEVQLYLTSLKQGLQDQLPPQENEAKRIGKSVPQSV